MDVVRVWKGARSEVQIRDAMLRRLGGREPGLAALWRFDHVENGVVKDLSPGGHALRLVGDAKVISQARSFAPDIRVADEPLATLQSVEQRVTHLLRLDGANGALAGDGRRREGGAAGRDLRLAE